MANGPVQMPPWVAPGAKSAREFVSKLGIVGDDDFAAILVRDVQTGDDSGRQVPQKVKRAWQLWNLRGGNPDKGGGEDEHMAMYQEYEDFKEWFPNRFEHEKHERTAKQKQRASDAEKAAIAARADSRLEEATEFATLAIAAYRAVHNWYTQEMQPTAMNQAAFDLRRAQELFDTIRQEAEEAENIRREKQEHSDLTFGLNSFFNSVCGIVDGLAIPQKFDKLRAFFDEKEKESKAEIVRLEADIRKKDEKMQEMHIEIDGVTRQLRKAKHDCTELQAALEQHTNKVSKLQNENSELQTQWDELIQETSPDNTNSVKAGWDWRNPFSKSSKTANLKANITTRIQEIHKHLEEENENLKREVSKLHEEMRSSQDVHEIKFAEAQENFNRTLATEKNRYDQLDEDCDKVNQQWFQKTEQLKLEAAQSAKQIEQLCIQKELEQKQCDLRCKPVERKTQIVEKAAQQKEQDNTHGTDFNQKSDLQEQESEGAMSNGADYDHTVYEDTVTQVLQLPEHVLHTKAKEYLEKIETTYLQNLMSIGS